MTLLRQGFGGQDCAQEFRGPDPVDQALKPIGGDGVALRAQTLLAEARRRRWEVMFWMEWRRNPSCAYGAWCGEGLA